MNESNTGYHQPMNEWMNESINQSNDQSPTTKRTNPKHLVLSGKKVRLFSSWVSSSCTQIALICLRVWRRLLEENLVCEACWRTRTRSIMHVTIVDNFPRTIARCRISYDCNTFFNHLVVGLGTILCHTPSRAVLSFCRCLRLSVYFFGTVVTFTIELLNGQWKFEQDLVAPWRNHWNLIWVSRSPLSSILMSKIVGRFDPRFSVTLPETFRFSGLRHKTIGLFTNRDCFCKEKTGASPLFSLAHPQHSSANELKHGANMPFTSVVEDNELYCRAKSQSTWPSALRCKLVKCKCSWMPSNASAVKCKCHHMQVQLSAVKCKLIARAVKTYARLSLEVQCNQMQWSGVTCELGAV